VAQSVGLIIYKNKAYVPVEAQTEAGFYFAVEPVFTTPTLEEMKKKDVILSITGAKSWKALAKNGASYPISWSKDGITLYMSRLDKKGRFETDPNKTRVFSRETPLQTIVEAILEDVQSRPELST
jgi:hypothetical protein